MELTLVLVALSLVASPALTILVMQRRDAALAEKLITYLRQNQATGVPVSIEEKRLEIRKMELEAEKQTRALRAAEMMVRDGAVNGVPPGIHARPRT